MSDYESKKGTLKRIPKENLDELNYYRFLIKYFNIKTDTFSEEKINSKSHLKELIEDHLYCKAIFIKDELWEVVSEQEINPYEDIFQAELKDNDTLDYFVKYYNGGCSFDEAINMAIKNNDLKV